MTLLLNTIAISNGLNDLHQADSRGKGFHDREPG
jgi:hypothetical protein